MLDRCWRTHTIFLVNFTSFWCSFFTFYLFVLEERERDSLLSLSLSSPPSLRPRFFPVCKLNLLVATLSFSLAVLFPQFYIVVVRSIARLFFSSSKARGQATAVVLFIRLVTSAHYLKCKFILMLFLMLFCVLFILFMRADRLILMPVFLCILASTYFYAYLCA